MPNTFTLSGTLNDGQNNPIVNKYVRFRVTSVGTDTEYAAVYPRHSFDFKTDSSGNLQGESGSNTVWVNGDSGVQSYYEISLPDGQKVDVVIPSSVEGTTVCLDDIIENYQVDGSTQQSTTLSNAKVYTDVLADDPTNNTSFDAANWRSGLNVADGAEVNDPTTVLDADIGVTVQAYDATIVNDADIGVNVQAYDDGLDDISNITPTNGLFIVGDGSNWVGESGTTARTSLGIENFFGNGTSANANATDMYMGDISGSGNGTTVFMDDSSQSWAFSGEMRLGDGLKLSGSTVVDTIETTLTDDDTHIPTSGAVVDYAQVKEDQSLSTTDSVTFAGVTVTGDTVIATETPASASATGTLGQVAWDADYIYICTATDTWKRVAIATW